MFDADDLSRLSPDQLEDELAAQAAHVNAGMARLLELVGECERRKRWHDDRHTFAQWLSWRLSVPPREAREHTRIGSRLAELPQTSAAFARGELSYAKVGLLTRVAEPESEAGLLRLAQVMTASQLERSLGAYRQLTTAQAADQQEHAYLRYHWTERGSLSLSAQLAADDGAVLLRGLEAGRQALHERQAAAPADARPAECQITNADALVAMADLALARPDADRTGGERYQLVVHLDPAALAGADGRCELDDGRPLATETARRLACDASLVDLHEHDGEPLTLGRKRRTISPPLRRALQARDRGCRFPGCDATRFVDAHHLQHWSQGGETNLDNLVLLCRRHHRLVHERGYTITFVGDGEVQWRNQHGIVIPNVPRSPPSHPGALPDQHRRQCLTIDAATIRKGHGDRMDLALAVDAIIGIVRSADRPVACADQRVPDQARGVS